MHKINKLLHKTNHAFFQETETSPSARKYDYRNVPYQEINLQDSASKYKPHHHGCVPVENFLDK